jgi:succinate dehydrogenase / fumarate reductase, cytochrome b subunit
MAAAPSPTSRSKASARPKYYDLNLLNLPAPGLVSIFHRITGVAMFLFLIPLVLWVFQATLANEAGFAMWKGYYANFFVKLVVVGFVWSFIHHLFAGVRYLLLDLHIGVHKEPAQASAKWVLGLGIVATAIVAARIW